MHSHDPRLVSPATWVVGSVVINGLLWMGLAYGTNRQVAVTRPAEIQIERITIDKEGKRTVKVIEPKKIKEMVKKLVEKNKLNPPKPTPPTPTRPTEPSHNNILTSKPTTPTPNDPPAVLPGGNAKLGEATSGQKDGNGSGPNNPPAPTPPAPKPPDPTPPALKPTLPPAPTPPAPTPPPPAPPPPPPPKPKGPSRDAEPSYKVEPTIPESLLAQEFKKSVRVRVHVATDGSFTVELRQSCGNPDVDKLAIEALKRWKWKPKLVEGEAVEDTQTFRFEFEVK